MKLFKHKRKRADEELEWELERALMEYYSKNAFQRMPRAMIDHYMDRGLTEHRIHQVARRTRKRFRLANKYAMNEDHATKLELMTIQKGIDSIISSDAYKVLIDCLFKQFPKHGSPELKKFIMEKMRGLDWL